MSNTTKIKLNFNVKKIMTVIWTSIAAFLLIHLLLQYLYHIHGIELLSSLRGRFNVDNEISLPTWFSQCLLLVPAIAALIIAKLSDIKKDGNRLYWLAIAGLFIFLSADEGAMLHEAFITKFREWTVDAGTQGLAAHTWLLPVGLILLLLAIPFGLFLRRLPRRTSWLLIAGIGTYVSGAIIIEALGLSYITAGSFAYEGLNVAFEEGLELAGTAITIYALLDYLKNNTNEIIISSDKKPKNLS